MLNFKNDTLSDGWKRKELPEKIIINPPKTLFKKLDENIIKEENDRLMK